ncbi:uncharacterized protein LAJ45_09907 [Morchella importuna]|uniref:uncharacterized protein n=1 Tax=Morchella importuna TaxID=1174673 RepID=UPI001E8DE49C|nr:uncharacterized protein LAJ45_09907 [Morchella importuna]KAH8145985.1 hypothetical protein LAJ45_09907 [Morchella importuna]
MESSVQDKIEYQTYHRVIIYTWEHLITAHRMVSYDLGANDHSARLRPQPVGRVRITRSISITREKLSGGFYYSRGTAGPDSILT